MITNDTQGFPHSDAQNAYDLLSDVCTLVLEEPKRLYMGVWGGDRGNAKSVIQCDLAQFGFTVADAPACGTIGCIAGWCEVLTGAESHSAYDILGATDDPSSFKYAVSGLFYHNFPDDGAYGTEDYATHVLQYIKAFQTKWETHLRNTSVRTR